MNLLAYCHNYHLDMRLMPVMRELPPSEWYLFHVHSTNESATLKTGYYTGVGANAKRVDMTDKVVQACMAAHFRFSVYNVAKRGGVTGNRVKIYFDKM